MLDRFRPLAVTVLAVWTLLMWTGRLGLAWGTAGSLGTKLWATVPIVLFVVLAVVALAVVVHRPGGGLDRRGRLICSGIAWWTIGYWVVRLPLIWFDGRSPGFKLVHTVLALGSWAASTWVLAALRTPGRMPGRASRERRSRSDAGSAASAGLPVTRAGR